MKMKFFLTIIVVSVIAMAGYGQDIQLPEPTLNEEASLKEALENRRSEREYLNSKPMDLQELSNLLWAGWGYNREDKRTAPSALNKQEITLYVCMKTGAYQYDAANNTLIKVTDKNLMKLSGKQPFVERASINIIYVCNTTDYSSPIMSAVCCGAISQNIALYCATAGLGNVVRGSFDAAPLKNLLGLDIADKIVLAQSVGYPVPNAHE